METYTMLLTCSNCKTRFEQEIPKGTRVADHVLDPCPYCGIKSLPREYCRPRTRQLTAREAKEMRERYP